MGHNPSYSEDTGYVNIHGQDVRVYVCEKTGRILVPIDELKEMGFRIYRKSQYSRLLIDDNQFSKEFDLYMLQSAQTYMLQNKIVFKENDILESINKCKAMLTGSQNDVQSPINFIKNEPKTSPSNFTRSFVTETSPTDITITTKLREPSASTLQNLQNDKMFKGFTQNKSPAALVNDKKTDSGRDNFEPRFNFENKDRNSFEQKKMNGPKFVRSESNTSFDSNRSFESKKSMSPKASNDNLAGKGGRVNATEQRRLTNFNQNGVDDEYKRSSESIDEGKEKLVTVELEKPEHNVLITHIEKQNCIWVQDVESADVIVEIDRKIKQEVGKQEKSGKFALNKIYLAQDEGAWYRCKIIKFRPLTVFFVDYGNTATVSELKEASETLAKIPCQAVRLTFNENLYKAQLFESIVVRIKRRYPNGTNAVDVLNKDPEIIPSKEPPPTPTPKTFFTKPQPLCKLEHGQRVMIIGHIDARLALRTKECVGKLQEIERALKEADPKSVDKVEKGQLVLCDKDKLQRAVVLNFDEKSAEIELLDHCEKIKVDSASLRHIDESLAVQPLTYVMTPPIKGYSEAADEIIRELIQKKSKPIVVLSHGEFDLKLGEELLSDKFSPPGQHSDRPLLKDFKFFEPSLGMGEYMLNVYRSTDELYFASGDALTEHLNTIIKSDLEDDSPYEPVMGEICFGLYQDSWSRCLVLRQMNFRYEVQFIDFGNLEFLKSDQLRKLTDDAKDTPILAIRCRLTGLPAARNFEELVKMNVSEGDNYEINVKKFDGEVYEIEMPSVYREMRASS